MTYTFASLSPADFEDLARDIVGREFNMRFEAFGPGPDGGMDGRHSSVSGETILQAKHYAGSTLAGLRRALKLERRAIDRIRPKRYILVTSLSLSDKARIAIANIIGSSLQGKADLISKEDLNGLLRKYPDIEKAHIKLWLSSAAVLERIVRSAFHEVTATLKAEIEAKVLVYAQNPSLKESGDKLESQRVLIISGPPGVGKTTLGEMLTYAYISEGWQFQAIRSLDDGFSAIDDRKRQIFFFDDFLGKVALDTRALASKDSDLARFVKRVRNSPNARFILTTRAYIFEEARRVSEHLAYKRLDISKYVLDVGIYTRRIRARILYNHLAVSNLPAPHLAALLGSGNIAKIVDHKNYNPRIVEWMTDKLHVQEMSPLEYPSSFMSMLRNPSQLWDIAFRTQILEKCKHLVLVVFFFSEYGVSIGGARHAYSYVHPHLCSKYGLSFDPKDFNEALRILEGGFLKITGQTISFINPSLRDYLRDYLNDEGMLKEFAVSYPQVSWAKEVWRHAQLLMPSDSVLRSLALAFHSTAETMIEGDGRGDELSELDTFSANMSNSERISLLLQWQLVSGDNRFGDLAARIALQPPSPFRGYRDGAETVEFLSELAEGGQYTLLACAEHLRDGFTKQLIGMLEGGMAADDLEKIADAVYESDERLDLAIHEAVESAVREEIESTAISAPEYDSESTLEDHISTIERLGKRVGVERGRIRRAVEVVRERIIEISQTPEDSTPEIKSPPFEGDKFDNGDLRNLFSLLVGSEDGRLRIAPAEFL